MMSTPTDARTATTTVTVRGFEIDALFSKIKLDGRPTVTFPLTSGVAQQ